MNKDYIEFLPHLAKDLRRDIVAVMDNVGVGAMATNALITVAATDTCRIAQLADYPSCEDGQVVAFNNPGASYSSFAHVISIDLRSWDYGSRFFVAVCNNRRGQQAIDWALECLAEHIPVLQMKNKVGDALESDLSDLAGNLGVDEVDVLKRMVASARIIEQITLCGRCDGTGNEPVRLGGGVCKNCRGHGREPQREAAE